MIILDTPHLSQLQRGDSRDRIALESRLSGVPRSDVWITVVTPYEQLRAVLGRINAAKTSRERVDRFAFLTAVLEHDATRWQGKILSFEKSSALIFDGFDPRVIRKIGQRDAWIAAIALAHDATLLTANIADFHEVSGLKVEDWLRLGT